MRQDLTEIIMVVDRSGSMVSCQSDAQGGINQFIEQHKGGPGEARLTLVQFDTEYDVVCDGVLMRDAPAYVLVPRGMTALLDAVGRAITTVGARFDKTAEDDRPGCVICVIVTDGHENSSREFSNAQIREMIERQSSTYNWKFTYLGADAAAFDEAHSIGIPRAAAMQFNTNKSDKAYAAVADMAMRSRVACCTSGVVLDCAYTDEERKRAV